MRLFGVRTYGTFFDDALPVVWENPFGPVLEPSLSSTSNHYFMRSFFCSWPVFETDFLQMGLLPFLWQALCSNCNMLFISCDYPVVFFFSSGFEPFGILAFFLAHHGLFFT